jgi:hypothetical protein
MSKDNYLGMMEQLGQIPKEEDIPPDLEDFMFDTITVFEIHGLLADDWDTFNGNYLGKKMELLPFLFKAFYVPESKIKMYITLLNHIILENTKIISDKAKQKQEMKEKMDELAKKPNKED